MSKRRFEDSGQMKKKNIDEVTQQLTSNSNEWPIYSHPDGGVIKITPWGSIRQYEVNGEVVTKFEDMSFNDYDFSAASAAVAAAAAAAKNTNNGNDSMGVNENYNELPQTPQSIQSIRLSPSDEAEQYVIRGYEADGLNNEFPDQYAKEPEHYFGMANDQYADEEMI